MFSLRHVGGFFSALPADELSLKCLVAAALLLCPSLNQSTAAAQRQQISDESLQIAVGSELRSVGQAKQE